MSRYVVVLAVSTCLALSTSGALANPASFQVTLSNALPFGLPYALVTVEVEEASECCSGLNGIKIVAEPNEELLIPGPNYGVQRLAFNYGGDPAELTFCFPNDPEGKWDADVGTPRSCSEFGVHVVDTSGTGSSRQSPLEVIICGNGDLTEEDFGAPCWYGCFFCMHIADFSFDEEDGFEDVDSAWFGGCQKTDANDTYVELSSFVATPDSRKVTLAWETGVEIDNLGFNVYRAASEGGEYIQINDALIAADGSRGIGASYEFVDTDVRNGKTYWYTLENLDIYGNSTRHEPVSATPRLIYLFLK